MSLHLCCLNLLRHDLRVCVGSLPRFKLTLPQCNVPGVLNCMSALSGRLSRFPSLYWQYFMYYLCKLWVLKILTIDRTQRSIRVQIYDRKFCGSLCSLPRKLSSLGANTINVFRACLGAQLTICAQKWRNFVLFSTVSLRFVLSRVCVFLYSLGPRYKNDKELKGFAKLKINPKWNPPV